MTPATSATAIVVKVNKTNYWNSGTFCYWKESARVGETHWAHDTGIGDDDTEESVAVAPLM